ncbi:hypothetical protein V5O48_019451, partial [Marasmius crinis-equi]
VAIAGRGMSVTLLSGNLIAQEHGIAIVEDHIVGLEEEIQAYRPEMVRVQNALGELKLKGSEGHVTGGQTTDVNRTAVHSQTFSETIAQYFPLALRR